MHCEIIDCHFSISFIEMQLKKVFLSTRVWPLKEVYWSVYVIDLINLLDKLLKEKKFFFLHD